MSNTKKEVFLKGEKVLIVTSANKNNIGKAATVIREGANSGLWIRLEEDGREIVYPKKRLQKATTE
jgi:RNase P/RNase MRP subunit p29